MACPSLDQVPDCSHTPTFQTKEVRHILNHIILRLPHACEQGTLTFKREKTSLRMHSRSNQDACDMQVFYLELLPSTFLGVVLVLQGEIEVLIFYPPDDFQDIMDLLASYLGREFPSRPIHWNRHVFPCGGDSGNLYMCQQQGLLFLYLRLSCPTYARETLLKQSQTPSALHKWGCLEERVLKDFRLRSKRTYVRPQHAGSCPLLTNILDAKCDEPFSQESYQKFAPFRVGFLARFLFTLPNACYGGLIHVVVNLAQKRARVYKDERVECDADLQGILVYIEFAPLRVSSKQVEEEIEKLSRARQLPSGHAVCLIINRERKEFEYFEPNGSTTPWSPMVFDALKVHMGQEYPTFRWVNTDEFCPVVGPQSESGLSMCANFSLLYLVLRLTCPHLEKEQVVELMFQRDTQRETQNDSTSGSASIAHLMQQWNCVLYSFTKQEHIPQAFLLLQAMSSFIKMLKSRYRETYERRKEELKTLQIQATKDYYTGQPLKVLQLLAPLTRIDRDCVLFTLPELRSKICIKHLLP